MSNPPTPEELRRAWLAMRHRSALRDWPAEFDQVMGDEQRARCVAIEATAARRRQLPAMVAGLQAALQQARYLPQVGRAQSPRHQPWPPNVADIKRAAAGDLDD